MNSEQLNNWFGIATNIGVIAGLIFVAYEIDQNTIALQAAAIQESTDVAREQILPYVSNADLNALIIKPISELNDEEYRRRFWNNQSSWLGMQGQFRQWQLGALPDIDWQVWYRIICINYGDGSSVFWEGNKEVLIPEFTDFVETECSDL